MKDSAMWLSDIAETNTEERLQGAGRRRRARMGMSAEGPGRGGRGRGQGRGGEGRGNGRGNGHGGGEGRGNGRGAGHGRGGRHDGFGPIGGGRGRARRGDIRAAILALLAEEPMNGYQIIQALGERTNGLWKPSPGAIYPALSQLEDEGLIVPTQVDDQKLFELTDEGRTAAAEVDPKPWDVVNERFASQEGDGADTLKLEFEALAIAARTVATTGTSAQIEQASDLVKQCKRQLFAVLAGDDE